MSSSARGNLLVPVETLNREFDGKLLLALIAAERGWLAILGGQTPIHASLPFLPRSLYFAKSARSQNRRMFEIMNGLGFGVVAQDEEALIRQSDEIYALKHDHGAFEHVAALFAWGQDNVDIWNRMLPDNTRPILAAGNPRVDMMRPELRAYHKPEIDAIRDRFGDFALFNTNFAVVNHFIPGKTRFQLSKRTPKEDTERLKKGMTEFKQTIFDRFRALIPVVARAIHPRNLVIRPHPSENHDAWKEAAAGLANVHVVHEGSVIPWLAATRVLLQNGCTSAIEAAAIGTPVVAYRPVSFGEFDPVLPLSVSLECTDDAATAEAIRNELEHPGAIGPRNRDLLQHHVAALDGPFSTERIVDFLDGLKRSDIMPPLSPASWAKAFLRHQKIWQRRRLSQMFQRSGSLRHEYIEHKFPPISADYVQARIDRFRHTLGGRFGEVRLRQMKPSIFELSKV